MAGRWRNAGTLLVTFAGASVMATVAAGSTGAGRSALADPLPRPPGHTQNRPVTAGPGHLTDHHPGKARHHRPRTVVRCQSDDTDQIDEIDDDGEEPRHYVSPAAPAAPTGACRASEDALGIARVLAGDHHRAVPVRRVPVR